MREKLAVVLIAAAILAVLTFAIWAKASGSFASCDRFTFLTAEQLGGRTWPARGFYTIDPLTMAVIVDLKGDKQLWGLHPSLWILVDLRCSK